MTSKNIVKQISKEQKEFQKAKKIYLILKDYRDFNYEKFHSDVERNRDRYMFQNEALMKILERWL